MQQPIFKNLSVAENFYYVEMIVKVGYACLGLGWSGAWVGGGMEQVVEERDGDGTRIGGAGPWRDWRNGTLWRRDGDGRNGTGTGGTGCGREGRGRD